MSKKVKTKIGRFDVRYIIKNGRNTCCCLSNKTIEDPIYAYLSDEIAKFFAGVILNDNSLEEKIIVKVERMFTKHYGEAKCCPSDTYDEELGKILAYGRLQHLLVRMRDRVVKDYGDTLARQYEQARLKARKSKIYLGYAINKKVTPSMKYDSCLGVITDPVHPAPINTPKKTPITNDTDNINVNHPAHYNKGIECIDYIESHELNFSRGNAVKYITRAGLKGDAVEDLQKAKWYISREIKRLKKQEL